MALVGAIAGEGAAVSSSTGQQSIQGHCADPTYSKREKKKRAKRVS